MSRLGKRPIPLPQGVEIKREKSKLSVKGKLGNLELDVPEAVKIAVADGNINVDIEEGKLPRPMHGLYRSLIQNAVTGANEGFKKELTLIGVGFKAAVKGQKLDVSVGYSHPCEVDIPKGVDVKVEKNTTILISGMDKQVVGQFASDVRAMRKPEPYKGKGIRYKDEYVRKKAGKAAKGK
ncbi:MAG: 50S ribosomal protein L6 [Chlamydiales bacterium]